MSKTEYELRGWVRGSRVGEGNQGFTFLAQKSNEQGDDWPYVLKQLKRQKDSASRRRMHIEVTTLQTLTHPCIVEVVDSNSHEFAGTSDLFMVTRRVLGSDLQELIQKTGKPSVEDCARIVLPILNALDFCHANQVVHRDIKPCHVILRGDALGGGVLIDFGLSFNEEANVGHGTELQIGVGNRFIGLPEQQAGAIDKRDARSDTTQIVGLLFFLLSGDSPGFIHDSNSRKPHQRINLASHIRTASVEQLKQLQRIFDVGFEYDPMRRWQTAKALIEEIERLLVPAVEKLDFAARVDSLRSRLEKSPDVIRFERLTEVSQQLKVKFAAMQKTVQSPLKQFIRIEHSCSGALPQKANMYPMTIGFSLIPLSTNCQSFLYFMCRSVSDELILQRNESLNLAGAFMPDHHISEVVRMGIFDPVTVESFVSRVEEELLQTISNILGSSG